MEKNGKSVPFCFAMWKQEASSRTRITMRMQIHVTTIDLYIEVGGQPHKYSVRGHSV